MKVGRSLGFCEVEMRQVAADLTSGSDSGSGKLLARGTHIKYLPMGRLWDCLASPSMLPYVVKGYEWARGVLRVVRGVGALVQGAKRGARRAEHPSTGTGTGTGTVDLDTDSSTDSSTTAGAAGAGAAPLYSGPLFRDSGATGAVYTALGLKPHHLSPPPPPQQQQGLQDRGRDEFEMRIAPFTKNLSGSLHGGAVAMAAEQAALLSSRAAATAGVCV